MRVREHEALGVGQEMSTPSCCIRDGSEHEEIVHSFTFRFQPCHHQSIAVNGDYCEEAGKC